MRQMRSGGLRFRRHYIWDVYNATSYYTQNSAPAFAVNAPFAGGYWRGGGKTFDSVTGLFTLTGVLGNTLAELTAETSLLEITGYVGGAAGTTDLPYIIQRSGTLSYKDDVNELFYIHGTKYYSLLTHSKGTARGEIVVSTEADAYPAPGYDEVTGYWYERRSI
ncbi:MAG: hypothetical protein ACYCWE_20890 [Eubacteriales bacterium]